MLFHFRNNRHERSVDFFQHVGKRMFLWLCGAHRRDFLRIVTIKFQNIICSLTRTPRRVGIRHKLQRHLFFTRTPFGNIISKLFQNHRVQRKFAPGIQNIRLQQNILNHARDRDIFLMESSKNFFCVVADLPTVRIFKNFPQRGAHKRHIDRLPDRVRIGDADHFFSAAVQRKRKLLFFCKRATDALCRILANRLIGYLFFR